MINRVQVQTGAVVNFRGVYVMGGSGMAEQGKCALALIVNGC